MTVLYKMTVNKLKNIMIKYLMPMEAPIADLWDNRNELLVVIDTLSLMDSK